MITNSTVNFGEFAPDVADYNLEVSRVATNVLPGVNSYLPVKTFTSASNALDEPCFGAVVTKDNAGNNYIYAGDRKKLYNISGVTVVDYSKALGYSNNSEKWSFATWKNQVIASKLGDAPQVLTLGSTTFGDLSGTPPQGRALNTVRNFVVFGNTFDSTDGNVTNRVWWSGFDNETQWTPGENQSNFFDLDGPGGAIKFIVGGEYGIIFQERSIWRMDYKGVPTVWEFNEIEINRGTPAAKSIVHYGNQIFYLGLDGFYVLNNGNTVPIGLNKVDDFFWNDVDQNYLEDISASIDPLRGYVYWAYNSIEANGTLDKILVYNYKTQRWSLIRQECQLLFQGASSSYTLEELDAFGDLDTLGSSLDSDTWKGGAFKLSGFTTDNELAYFSGPTMSSTIETGHIYSSGVKTSVTDVRPIIDGTTTVSLLTKQDALSDTESATIATSTGSDGTAKFRSNARYHRIRCQTSGDFTKAMGVEVGQVGTSAR